MREILYRAKRKDNGEWIEGLPSYGSDGKITELEYLKKIPGEEIQEIEYIEIDPETLCQYTGLNDKKGKKIFERDIVSFLDTWMSDNGYVESYCFGEVVWNNEMLSFQVTERLSSESYEVLVDCEVIGNIYDNPELLEV